MEIAAIAGVGLDWCCTQHDFLTLYGKAHFAFQFQVLHKLLVFKLDYLLPFIKSLLLGDEAAGEAVAFGVALAMLAIHDVGGGVVVPIGAMFADVNAHGSLWAVPTISDICCG